MKKHRIKIYLNPLWLIATLIRICNKEKQIMVETEYLFFLLYAWSICRRVLLLWLQQSNEVHFFGSCTLLYRNSRLFEN